MDPRKNPRFIFLSLANQCCPTTTAPPPCAFSPCAPQVKMVRARTSDSSDSSDSSDEESEENGEEVRQEVEEHVREFKRFEIDQMRAAVVAGRGSEFWRKAISAHFQGDAPGKRLGEKWDRDAQKRLERANRMNLSASWEHALRGRGVVEETKPRFKKKRNRHREERLLVSAERIEAEQARRALFPEETARYKEALARLLAKEAEAKASTMPTILDGDEDVPCDEGNVVDGDSGDDDEEDDDGILGDQA